MKKINKALISISDKKNLNLLLKNLSKHKIQIINSLTENNFFEKLNSDFKNYYISPGHYVELYNYCKNNSIDFQNTSIESFLKNLIYNYENKKNNFFKYNVIYFIEYFF